MVEWYRAGPSISRDLGLILLLVLLALFKRALTIPTLIKLHKLHKFGCNVEMADLRKYFHVLQINIPIYAKVFYLFDTCSDVKLL